MAFSLNTFAQVVQKKSILPDVAKRERERGRQRERQREHTTFAFFLAVLNYSGRAHKSTESKQKMHVWA